MRVQHMTLSDISFYDEQKARLKWNEWQKRKMVKRCNKQHNILRRMKLVYYIHKFNIFEENLLPGILSYADTK